jgi:hypothetical protein
VKQYNPFEQLTSISVNSTNNHLCVSGYSNSVWLYDVATGAVAQKFEGGPLVLGVLRV